MASSPFLVVGLGNPGPEYTRTRHNIGFHVTDELLTRFAGCEWQQKFKGAFSKIRIRTTDVLLLKPFTFMNLSGRSVQQIQSFYKLDLRQILVIHDDIDLQYGIVRLKSGGGTGGHKGIESCRRELGDTEFHRLRVGVGRPEHGNVSDFVLSRFSTDEEMAQNALIDLACDAIICVVTSGMTIAMNQYNQRQGDN